MDRCEYPQILKFIDAKIPGFFEKYPGYKIFLLKLQYFSMILKEEPRDKIMHFFNKDLFPLLNKYAIKDLDQDYFDFKTLIEETNIIKCRTYKQAWKNACQIFMEGISLCFDNLFLIQENKNNSSIYNEYNKNKENFAKEVNTLFRFEKVINEYYKSYKSDEFHLYEPENIFSIRDNSDLDKEPLISFNLSDNSEENLSFFSGKNPFESNYKSDFIFEHKKIFINSKVYNKEKNNNKNQTNINDKKIESISINSNNISNKNKLKYKNETNPKLKSYKYDGRKKKIKEYKFKKVKRENLDKKILRKFKKFLKHSLREKTENEVKNYIKNNGFWPDYIWIIPFKRVIQISIINFTLFIHVYILGHIYIRIISIYISEIIIYIIITITRIIVIIIYIYITTHIIKIYIIIYTAIIFIIFTINHHFIIFFIRTFIILIITIIFYTIFFFNAYLFLIIFYFFLIRFCYMRTKCC